MACIVVQDGYKLKRCTQCLLGKPLPEFHAWTRSKDGVRSRCKTCRSAEARDRRLRNHSEYLSRERSRYKEREAIIKDQKRKWTERNRSRLNDKSRAWAAANRQKRMDTCRRYRLAHPERIAATRKRYEASPAGKLTSMSKWHKRRALRAASPSRATKAERAAIFARAGGRCEYCKTRSGTLWCRRLTLDHIIPLNAGGHDSATNLAAACNVCNPSKSDRDPIEWARERFGATGVAMVQALLVRP